MTAASNRRRIEHDGDPRRTSPSDSVRTTEGQYVPPMCPPAIDNGGVMTTREEAIAAAAQILADAYARMAGMTPEQIAAEAYQPGGPSREEIAARIRRDRGQS